MMWYGRCLERLGRGLGVTLPLMCVSLMWPMAASAQGKMLKMCAQPDMVNQSQVLNFGLTHSQVPGRLAVTTHEVKADGQRYRITAVSEAKGMLALLHAGQLNQMSEGRLLDKRGYQPLNYMEKRGKKPAKEVEVQEADKQVVFKKNGQTAPYLTGLQDRLSLVYQLAAVWACNGKETPGLYAQVPVMSTGKIETEVFTAQGTENLELEWGSGKKTVQALQIANKPNNEEDDVIRVWLAPDLGWLPVQIQVQEPKGTKMTQTLIGPDKKL